MQLDTNGILTVLYSHNVHANAICRAPIFPRFRGFPRKWSFRIHEKKTTSRKKTRPNLFLKRQLKLMQTASKLQPRADDRILHLVFALRYEISRDQPVAIVFWVKMPHSDFVCRHETAFRDFHIFLVGALNMCTYKWNNHIHTHIHVYT